MSYLGSWPGSWWNWIRSANIVLLLGSVEELTERQTATSGWHFVPKPTKKTSNQKQIVEFLKSQVNYKRHTQGRSHVFELGRTRLVSPLRWRGHKFFVSPLLGGHKHHCVPPVGGHNDILIWYKSLTKESLHLSSKEMGKLLHLKESAQTRAVVFKLFEMRT